MWQDAEEEIGSPRDARQKAIEIKRLSVDPHADEDQWEKINPHLMADIVARRNFFALMDCKPSQSDQNDNPNVQIPQPGWSGSPCCAGDQKDGC